MKQYQSFMGWLLLFLHLFLFTSSSSSFNFLCHHDESDALLQFKSSFTIVTDNNCDEPASKTATWKNESSCCSWDGVTCDTISGHVVGLNLGCEGIYGILHPNSTLFHLPHLQSLNLSHILFYDSHFHFKFGRFLSLTHLDLSWCNLQGEVPLQISHLSKLESLNLSGNNNLVWKETTLKRLVQNATNLRNLFLDETDMSSINPNSIVLTFNHSSSLVTHLDLSYCNLQGEVPIQISHLSKLESLQLSLNPQLVWKETTLKRLVQNATNLKELFLEQTDMSSIRPDSIDLIFNQSSSLVTLNLQKTGLSGKLKKSIFCLPNIEELDISDNINLEIQLQELSCSTSLRILDLSACLFKGPIPLSFSNFTHLTSLFISKNNLNGSIPSSLLTLPHLTSLMLDNNDLSGQIPNVFPQSNKFQKLYLDNNKIGGLLPTSLSNLQQLTDFSLSNNLFRGKIQDVFGGMTKLQYLYLGSNNFEGKIPSSLFSMTQLIILDFSYNKLEGPLPNKITGFQNLINLSLNDNLLSGTIPPSFLSLPSLEYLYLTNNQFTGHISPFSSYSLRELYLNSNMLEGNLPESLFNLANLTKLILSSNNLSGLVDFKIFSNLQSLEYLSLSHNSQLSLNFESSVRVNFSYWGLGFLDLSSLSLTQFPKLLEKLPVLTSLDMSNNKLNGKVPNWLLDMELQFLNLSQNLLTSINQLSGNNYFPNGLDLSFNLLDGEISLSICNKSSIILLNLAYNKLTGTIPHCLANFSSLRFLDLQMNKFYGTVPSNFSKDSDLETLNLNGNQLEGHIPKSLSHCKNMQDLNLGNNRIEDKFPDWLQTLQNLKVLVLGDNKLYGPIANLKIKHPFPSLVIFDISGNNFSGPLPKAYLRKFEAMKNVVQLEEEGSSLYMRRYAKTRGIYFLSTVFGLVTYYDSVTVTIKRTNMAMVKILTIFVNIDLSRNKFEGEIPNVIGELHALVGLNLSHNKLTGPIPKSMGNLTNLESLDLSSNMLTSHIPAEFSNLNNLEVLDLSNNHLVGEIPQGKQFYTFTNDSYEGNLELCGFPLTKNCGPEPEQHHSPPSADNIWSEEKFGFGWKPVAIGYGCGFVIGIGIGYLVFLIGKPRWLVMIFGGQPKRRVNRRRTRVRRTNGSTQMVQMS